MHGVERREAVHSLTGNQRVPRALSLAIMFASIPCLCPAAALAQQLPKSWLAEWVAEQSRAGALPTPAEEVWRCERPGLQSVFVRSSGGRLFIKRDVMSSEALGSAGLGR